MISAEIIPTVGLSRKLGALTYTVPEKFSEIKRGDVVRVPLGKKTVLGAVTSVNHDHGDTARLREIISLEPLAARVTEASFRLVDFISREYCASPGLVMRSIVSKPAPRARRREDFFGIAEKSAPPVLTPSQKSALERISACLNKAEQFLLFGVTGSGKTEVYLRSIEKVLSSSRQALVLVPEIALTPQTLARFASRFGNRSVAVVHSRLSYGQKFLIWKGVESGEIQVLIGPRSAIFAPFKNLGLIVLDEEHDPSYKQSEQNPRFHTRTAAAELGRIWNCPLVLGDATPSLETFYRSETDLIQRLELPERINQPMPGVEIVDMGAEARAGNFSIFSSQLLKKISNHLASGRQIILFLNRRGQATSMVCRDCGTVVACDRCSSPLPYHRSRGRLVCHHCNRNFPLPDTCVKCRSARLKLAGTGTEKVEEEILARFPQARLLRLDSDSVSAKRDLQRVYQDFLAHRFDIVVGTQLVAQGWDLSGVGLIGVINADTSLAFPDFRSLERTFQLITQVAGRAGRGSLSGEAVFQTYSPQNSAILAALNHDYRGFYHREIADRKLFGYPPFSRLVKLAARANRPDTASELIRDSLEKIRRAGARDEWVVGPVAAFVPRVRGQSIFYGILKLPLEEDFLATLRPVLLELPRNIEIDIDPDSLL